MGDIRAEIAAMQRAVKGGAIVGGVLWFMNDGAGEGVTHA